ncbi:MAG: S41 family peptidase, partial [Alphaproteobacteria bacterium]|nr:S41 family peptidase [Alphaproteobacteria bacterium]
DAAREAWRPRALAAVDDGQLYAAINGMLDLLDDAHAHASSPAARRRQDAQNRDRPVIGVTVARTDDGGYRVESVREGSAAADAGVQPGWRLGGGWTPDHDVLAGQVVRVDFLDEAGGLHALELMPRIMPPLPVFVADRSRPGVLVLSARAFDPGMGRWMGEELRDLPPEVDVVLDLRANAGGRLWEAEAVLSCFLPRDMPWAWRTGRGAPRRLLKTEAPCGALEAPIPNDLAVLVGPASRSAAELTPAALQESGRAVIVGAPTSGAVLISLDTDLPDGGRLTLSRADFITISGVRLEKAGVRPDVITATADAALDAAIAALADPAEAAATGSPPN